MYAVILSLVLLRACGQDLVKSRTLSPEEIEAILNTVKVGLTRNRPACEADIRSGAAVTLSRSQTKNPLLWVSTQEGLLAHYFQAELLWRIVVLQHRRPLVIAPFTSPRHFGRQAVSLCDYLDMPEGVHCISPTAYSESHGRPLSCRCNLVANASFVALPQFSEFKHLSTFGLPRDEAVLSNPNFSEEQCLAGFVHPGNAFLEPSSSSLEGHGQAVSIGRVAVTRPGTTAVIGNASAPIFPHSRPAQRFLAFVPALRAALRVRGVGRRIDDTHPALESFPVTLPPSPFSSEQEQGQGQSQEQGQGPATELTVVHWRRGDYLSGGKGRKSKSTRCSRGLDKSVNCGTAAAFIKEVKRALGLTGPPAAQGVVYVATNEGNWETLEELKGAGFKIRDDIIEGLDALLGLAKQRGLNSSSLFPLPLPMTPPDAYAVDLALACTAERHLHFGFSSYNQFVQRCRGEERDSADSFGAADEGDGSGSSSDRRPGGEGQAEGEEVRAAAGLGGKRGKGRQGKRRSRGKKQKNKQKQRSRSSSSTGLGLHN